MKHLFDIPEDFSAFSAEELNAFITDALAIVSAVREDAGQFLVDGRDAATLMNEMTDGVAAIEAAKAALTALEPEEAEAVEDETPVVDEIDADALAELTNRVLPDPEAETTEEVAEVEEAEPVAASADEPEAEPETVEPEAVVETEPEPVVASAPAPKRKPLRRPARSRAAEPVADAKRVALTAAAENLGFGLGQELPDELALATMMAKRRAQFGSIPEGTHGEQVPIARAEWGDLYPPEHRLSADWEANQAKIEAVTASAVIRENFQRKLADAGSLTASGGLCAPVTPYYSLQMLSVADRPVRGALPAFNADRGGINAARPAALTAIDDAVGIITEAEDAAGGSSATKTCQVIDCPPFVEVDVSSIYHCLQFGNLGARAFPELVAQWNALVLSAHARVAETALLDGIDDASTAVTADALGLGASATLPSQILAAANGMRSRHRMERNAVLRVMLPSWVLDLLVSDVYRTQFQRFDMSPEQFVAVLRRGNVDPTFYIDGATGAGQIFGAQSAGELLSFPPTVRWYLYPEGSFLYLDGGVLELGLVRDSVLNATNDFQLFGEIWENVAFVGVESLAITTTTCDSGTVAAPADNACPTDYGA